MNDPLLTTRRAFLARSLAFSAGMFATGALAACSAGDDDAADGTTASGSATSTTTTTPVATDPATIARNAFLAGFPLVTTVRTMQTFAGLFGVNRLFVGRGLANPTSHFVVAPNHDTVYVLAILDLRDGPYVLEVPASPDRYHVFQFLDAWMGDFALVGTRTSGGRAAAFVIVPPGYEGAVPAGHDRLAAPTNQAMMLGRIRAVDDADARAAAAIGDQIRLNPLAATGSAPRAMPPPAGTPQSVGTNGIAYFDELGDALAVNAPVTSAQRAAIEAAAVLGVGAGMHPSAASAVTNTAVLTDAIEAGFGALSGANIDGRRTINGWDVNTKLGGQDDDANLQRQAVIAKFFWGPVPAAEAVYPRATAASDGQPLDGTKRYRIRFAPGATPPVDAFWSVTAYGPDMFLVPNSANRYSISGDTPDLVIANDGTIDIALQHEPPTEADLNWLPVPAGPFNVIMRCYLPRAPIVDGTYSYPPIAVVA
jgi:hypothetical protein